MDDLCFVRAHGQQVRVTPTQECSLVDVIRNIIYTDEEGHVTQNANVHALTVFRRCCSDMQIATYKFKGRGQQCTPVACPTTARQVIGRIVARSRMSLDKKTRIVQKYGIHLDCGVGLKVYVEAELVPLLQKVFSHFRPQAQLAVGPYRIDLYFPMQHLAVECDEFGHIAYASQDEKCRETYISNVLHCRFFRFNPQSKGFCQHAMISDLMQMLYKLL